MQDASEDTCLLLGFPPVEGRFLLFSEARLVSCLMEVGVVLEELPVPGLPVRRGVDLDGPGVAVFTLCFNLFLGASSPSELASLREPAPLSSLPDPDSAALLDAEPCEDHGKGLDLAALPYHKLSCL
ncbi:hypothetical protein N7517_001047 [Penicillium concentricum]|uniref:Uncharacterized protein n=1 Tax=Penicillium concentricum TaxID=293559 RepID=A0A9W9SRF3_9EURO|nr:uncharacterized protein N7517_001047 [Penicillium concentricum]KAJ5383136.1 hypothetical protein N7517_001047 [Penicillium concentricum]